MDGGDVAAAAKDEYKHELDIKIPEYPGTRGGAGGLKEIDLRHDTQREQRRAAGKEIRRGACHPLVRRL
jgi:hypothetical protein